MIIAEANGASLYPRREKNRKKRLKIQTKQENLLFRKYPDFRFNDDDDYDSYDDADYEDHYGHLLLQNFFSSL